MQVPLRTRLTSCLGRLLQSHIPTPVMTHLPPVGIQWLKGFMSVLFLSVCRIVSVNGTLLDLRGGTLGCAVLHGDCATLQAPAMHVRDIGGHDGQHTVEAACEYEMPARRASPRTSRRIAKNMLASLINAAAERRRERQ
jgi:hypothetical protein